MIYFLNKKIKVIKDDNLRSVCEIKSYLFSWKKQKVDGFIDIQLLKFGQTTVLKQYE